VRVVVLNLGVALLAVGPQRGWTVVAGRWLVGLALGWFVLLAGAVLARRVAGRPRRGAALSYGAQVVSERARTAAP
jgi:hypothetical protein